MKKILLGAFAICALCSAAAHAELNVELNLGQPVYAAPVYAAPVYVAPYPHYYDPRHRTHDFEYWQERHRARDRQAMEQHDGRFERR